MNLKNSCDPCVHQNVVAELWLMFCDRVWYSTNAELSPGNGKLKYSAHVRRLLSHPIFSLPERFLSGIFFGIFPLNFHCPY